MVDPLVLTPAQHAALVALTRRLLPAADADEAPAPAALADLVEQRLAAGSPAVMRQLRTLLDLHDHPLTALATTGRATRFSRRSPREQDAWLDAWATSRLPLRRTVFQAFRRLVLSTHYARPAAQAAIGCRGPFHDRAPELPWEGVLPGTTHDSEPVARGMRLVQSPRRAARPAAVIEGVDLPATTTAVRAGVCVVGTGAGGAVVAARLAEAGHDVVLLEEGGYWTAPDFTERESEMMPRLYAEAGGRATDDLGVAMLQGRAVGGGTVANWMLMLRPPDRVLDEWAAEHGTEGMSPAEMAAVFELIEHEVHARVVPPDAHSAQNGILLEGARRLGWRVAAAAVNATECVRAGFCGLGCRYDAKQSALLTYLPRALAAGARLFADVQAVRIEQLERAGPAPLKRVHGRVLDRVTGRERGALVVEAPIVVVAGGAVGTPVLLERSGMGGGGAGRYLRLHPTSAVLGRYGCEVYGAAGIPLSAACDEFLAGDGDGYGFWIECAPSYPAFASTAVPGFGAAHRALMEEFPRLGNLIVLVRDGADRRRSDGEVRLDRRGRVRIAYRLGAAERRQLVLGLKAAARIHLAAGAVEALTLHHRPARVRAEPELAVLDRLGYAPNQLGLFSAHVNGTCRIGRDPRTSGCTPAGERHGAPGVYVADGSLLPTAPGVNPQETIMAVATVVAQRIIDRHRPS